MVRPARGCPCRQAYGLEGHSFKHEQDIRDILVAVHLGDDPELTNMFDSACVDAWTAHLGDKVQGLWENLKAAA